MSYEQVVRAWRIFAGGFIFVALYSTLFGVPSCKNSPGLYKDKLSNFGME